MEHPDPENYPMKDLSKRTALLVRFGYDGAGFFGLQPQPGLQTAGGALEKRLHDAVSQQAPGARPKGLAFAARTDRGVHAVANLATCYFLADKGTPALSIDVDALGRAAAVDRPDGLRHVEVRRVPPNVHARGISRGKHYRYLLRDRCDPAGLDGELEDGPHDGLQDGQRWRVVPPLDVDVMNAAASVLAGRHDFSSFRAGGCTAAQAQKTLYRFEVSRRGDDVVVDLVGDAFLRKMVRNLVGFLAEIGSGWRPFVVVDVVAVLEARHRQAAGLCAPPDGLTLMAVGSAWPDDGEWLLPDAPAVRVVDGVVDGGVDGGVMGGAADDE